MGLVDELDVHIAPIFLGKGIRLFEKLKKENFTFEIVETIGSAMVIHLFFKVINH